MRDIIPDRCSVRRSLPQRSGADIIPERSGADYANRHLVIIWLAVELLALAGAIALAKIL